MKKILLINNGYPSKTNPQYSTYIRSIYECLIQAGLDVEVLALDTNFTSKKEKIFKYIEYYKKLFLKDYSKYDNVYIHNYPHSFIPLIFKLKKMKKLTIHWHGTDIFASSRIGKVLNTLSYLFLPKFTTHMTPSKYFAGQVSNKLHIDVEEIHISPSGGIDTDIFKPRTQTERNEIILGFASSMTTEKGMDFVLKLIQNTAKIEQATNKKIKLLCITYGKEREYFSIELSKFDNVSIIPPMPKNKMVDFYQKIDLLLLLSTRMSESLALVGLEAMSCNVPVIGTDDFAIKEYIINGETGEKFEKGNYNEFLNAVVTGINSLPSYTPRNKIINEYSKHSVIEQYKTIMEVTNNDD